MNLTTLKYNCSRKLTPAGIVENLTKNDFLPREPHFWDTDNYQVYTDDWSNVNHVFGAFALFSKLSPYTHLLPDWVIQARIKRFGRNEPYSHTSGKLFSRETFSPPFRLESVCEVPTTYGHVPSVWLRNDLEGITRELDMFEADLRGVFFSWHTGGHNYQNHDFGSQRLYVKPTGLNHFALEVEKNRADWWMNGVHLMTKKENWDVPYHVLATLGVVAPTENTVEWEIESIKILR